jgi:hypothetical protein
MTELNLSGRSVSVCNDGRTLAAAEIADHGAAVFLQFRVGAGPLPSTVRQQLIEATFNAPELKTDRPIKAALPLGDIELLEALRQHCRDVHVRAAGASCLVDGHSVSKPKDTAAH